ncbi:MAG: hypothetical protein HY707_03600 [Ignavibacteriae bacterium]|nr:hypothetical protein [Ignavibacteriota bacterium]
MRSDFEKTCRESRGYSYMVANVFAMLGEKQQALDWLEHSVSRGFLNYPRMDHGDPFLENIRDEERFKKLMDRVKYEWEHFEV